MADDDSIATSGQGLAGQCLSNSLRQWLADLATLRQHAQALFGDVAWLSAQSGETMHAHKYILYARAPGGFLRRHLERAPQDAAAPVFGHSDLDVGILEAALDWFYTAEREAEAFTILLDGFGDADDDGPGLLATTATPGWQRLQRDLLYCWRSKLYADTTLIVECAPETPFAAHRAMLAARTPYFRALVTGEYRDSQSMTFALPSPPFTPAATTFVLGWVYGGSLQSVARRFDFDTACDIWRSAAFLSADALQEEVEEQLVAMMSNTRAARILAFARAADVRSESLASKAMDYLVDHFDTSWTASAHVGQLSYADQTALVQRVGDRVTAANVVATSIRLASCKRALPPRTSPWVEHVRAMIEGVEDRLVVALKTDVRQVVRTPAFLGLIDGVGFNNDVLEWLLSLVIRGLDEKSAPRAYQSLLFDVVRREGGIMADARLLVLEALEGVLSYIRRRLHAVQSAGGLDGLASECAEELATALSVTVVELQAATPDAANLSTRPARSVPQHLIEGKRQPSRPSLPTAAPTERRHALSPVPTRTSTARQATDPLRQAAQAVGRVQRMPTRESAFVHRAPSTRASSRTPSYGTSRVVDSSSVREGTTRKRVLDNGTPRRVVVSSPGGAPRAARTSDSSGSIRLPSNAATSCRGSVVVGRGQAALPRMAGFSPVGSRPGLRGRSLGSPAHAPASLSLNESAPPPGVLDATCTVLRCGVPCMVRVREGDRACSVRAEVKFIGPLPGTEGDWLGVEAAEHEIPRDAADLPWSDGSSLSCLQLRKEVAQSRQARITPLGCALSENPQSDGPEEESSIHPEPASGRTRALFVRPEQVTYIVM